MSYKSVKEFAQELGVSQDTVYRWIREKKIKVLKFSRRGRNFIPMHLIEEQFLKRRKKDGN